MPPPLLGIGFLGTMDSEWRNQGDPTKNQPLLPVHMEKAVLLAA